MATLTVENYLKALYSLSEENEKFVSTTAISKEVEATKGAVTSMLKRLDKEGLVKYERYQGGYLTKKGEKEAVKIVRKHRLWEYFLVEKLGLSWDEVHDIAEQLEHIKSPLLIQKLDDFLGHPKFDPHGDPIPDENGKFAKRSEVLLADVEEGKTGVVVGVNEHSTGFLKYLNELKLGLGTKIKVLNKLEYDQSIQAQLDDGRETTLSQKVSKNIYVNVKE